MYSRLRLGRLLSVSPLLIIRKKKLVPRNTASASSYLFNSCFSPHELAAYLFFKKTLFQRYLSDSSHRETHESAHSVILSIFALHAQRQQHPGKTKTTNVLSGVLNAGGGDNAHVPDDGKVLTPISNPLREAEEESVDLANFVERMVPFYAQCLIEVGVFLFCFRCLGFCCWIKEIFTYNFISLAFALSFISSCKLIIALLQNSVDGKLSTSQLCLAYSTLVRSATMTSTGVPDDTYTLAWYCIQLLVDTIRDLSPLSYTSRNSKGKEKALPKTKLAEADNNTMKTDERTHRLSLMLISTISSLPMSIMLRALDEVYVIISAYSSSSRDDDGNLEGSSQSERRRRKKELLEALFSEILEKIGDCEKEAAMKWWYTHRPVLISESSGHGEGQGPLSTILSASSSWFTKRWRGVEKVKDVDASGEREKNQLSSSNSFILSRL